MANKKKGPSVETERPLTIACHMKKSSNNILKSYSDFQHLFSISFDV